MYVFLFKKPNQAVEILSDDLSTIKSICKQVNECFVHFSLRDVYGSEIAPENYLFFEKVKNMNLITPKIEVSV